MSDNLPPEPEKPRGGSDREYLQWKKRHAEWSRLVRQAGSDPERNEEEAIERARQRGDRDFEQGVEELLGYSMDEVREALRKTDEKYMSNGEIEAKRALERADNAWFFKASAQREAGKKIGKAKKDIQGRIKKKSWCSLWALAGLVVATAEIYIIGSGVADVIDTMAR